MHLYPNQKLLALEQPPRLLRGAIPISHRPVIILFYISLFLSFSFQLLYLCIFVFSSYKWTYLWSTLLLSCKFESRYSSLWLFKQRLLSLSRFLFALSVALVPKLKPPHCTVQLHSFWRVDRAPQSAIIQLTSSCPVRVYVCVGFIVLLLVYHLW